MREIRLIKIVIFMGLIFLSAGQCFSAACDFVPVEGKKYQYKLWRRESPVCQNYLKQLNDMGVLPTSLCKFVPPPNNPDYRVLEWKKVDLDVYLPLLRKIIPNNPTRQQDGMNMFWDIFDKVRSEQSFPITLEKTQVQIFPDGRVNTVLKLTFRSCSWGMEPSLFVLNEDETGLEKNDGQLTYGASDGGGDLFYYKNDLYIARLWNRLLPQGSPAEYVFSRLDIYKPKDSQHHKITLTTTFCLFSVTDLSIF